MQPPLILPIICRVRERWMSHSIETNSMATYIYIYVYFQKKFFVAEWYMLWIRLFLPAWGEDIKKKSVFKPKLFQNCGNNNLYLFDKERFENKGVHGPFFGLSHTWNMSEKALIIIRTPACGRYQFTIQESTENITPGNHDLCSIWVGN